MKVTELARDQLIELKERCYLEHNNNVSWGEIANIDKLVTDAEIFDEYDCIDFVEDDFFCKGFKDIDQLFELWLLDHVTGTMVEDFMNDKIHDIEEYYLNETGLDGDEIINEIDKLDVHLKNKYACELTDKQVEDINKYFEHFNKKGEL